MNRTLSLKTDYVSYDLQLSGKYTVIVGDSGTGKTSLAKLCDDIYNGYPD